MMANPFPNPGMPPQGMAHPMVPGPPHGPPGMAQMQMGHPGVSGPNGPVSQAGPMMGGGMPGGPNPHAMSHLQPQQQQMFAQNPQQQGQPAMMQMNPAMMQQRQMAMLARQQQIFAQQHNQPQPNGMGMGFPPNMPGGMANPQMAMHRPGQPPFQGVNLPDHMRQQMSAIHHQPQQPTSNPMLHQQHQAHLAQQQAQQHQAQQLAHQQQLQQQQQHMHPMQHVQSQQSNHSQAGGSQGGPPNQGQQGPVRPPSAVGSHQSQASPAPQPAPQQHPPQQPQQQNQQPQPPPQQTQPQPPQAQPQGQQNQHPPQPNQPQPPSQPQPQSQQSQQQQGPQQGPQPPQQAPGPNQPPPGPQQSQPNQQGQNPQMVQRNPATGQPQQQVNQAQMQQMARHMAQQQAQAQAQRARDAKAGTLKLLNFCNELGNISNSRDVTCSQETWETLISKFFDSDSNFILNLWNNQTDSMKMYTVVRPSIPRFLLTLYTTDVDNLQITMDGVHEMNVPGHGNAVVCDRAKLIFTHQGPCSQEVVWRGSLKAFYGHSERLQWLQFDTERHDTFIPRHALEQLFSQPSPSQLSQTHSPRMSKNTPKQRQQQRLAQENMQPMLKKSDLPAIDSNEYGLPGACMYFFEIYETMNTMGNAMEHWQNNITTMTPGQAVGDWARQQERQMAANQRPPNQPGMQPQQQMGPRPGAQFMSPAMANSLLPNAAMNGSPHLMHNHTPSPASLPMQNQLSQQGSSTTASVNTSPNVTNNKRRRSTVKAEGDDAPEMNGANKVKQSPRVGGNKRLKNS